MIRFGPAGIPLSCKGRTLKDGIEDVHNLSLTAMEIQMVRAATIEMSPEDEDIGRTPNDIEDHMILEMYRDGELICDPRAPIEEDDILIAMASGITNNMSQLATVGRLAKRLDISMSLHAPNYIDISMENDLAEMCLNSIRHAGIIVNELGGNVVVTSLGLVNSAIDREDAINNIYGNVDILTQMWKDCGLKPKIGVELTAHDGVFGSLDEVLDICDEFRDSLVPVINFPNYHARTGEMLVECKDFEELIAQVKPYCDGNMHTLFAGIGMNQDNEFRLTPIKKGSLKFETLAETLVELRPEMTIISNSPLLEHDAMYTRIIYERNCCKKIAKAIRLKKKEEEAAASGEAAASEE